MYMLRKDQQRISSVFLRKFGFSIAITTDNNITVFKGLRPYEEFEARIPDILINGLRRYEALIEMLEGGWLRVKPEIFLDVTTNRIGVRVPYQADLINEIKTFIPPAGRSWDGQTKTWYVNPAYMDQIERIVKKHFPDVTITTPGQDLMPVDGDVYSRLLHPLPDAALKAVYRAIAIACHPDRAAVNGLTIEQATELMRTVNVVWEEIKKAKGWKA